MVNSASSINGNLASFDLMISSAKGYDVRFNPSNSKLTITALEAKSLAGHNQLANHNTVASVNKVAVERRIVLFSAFDPLVTRIFNFAKSTDASQVMIGELASIVRKLQGKRAGKKLDAPTEGEATQGPKQISVSQRGYDDRLNNFDKLIRQVELITEYAPNETDLTVASLRAYYNRLDTANKAAIKAAKDLANATIERDKELCDPQTGLIEIGKAGKLYIKAAFGANSPEYHQVSKIAFKKYKR